MCNCKDVELGSYDNQVELSAPKHLIEWAEKAQFSLGGERKTVCVDKCLEKEIKALWSEGIITTGCCCGHNKVQAYIGVEKTSVNWMKAMGYKEIKKEHFEPMTVSYCP